PWTVSDVSTARRDGPDTRRISRAAFRAAQPKRRHGRFIPNATTGARRSRRNSMKNKFRLILGAAALLAAVPLGAQVRGDEPIAVPTSIKQGVDFVYVDPQMITVAKPRQKPRNWLQRIFGGSREDQQSRPNPM